MIPCAGATRAITGDPKFDLNPPDLPKPLTPSQPVDFPASRNQHLPEHRATGLQNSCPTGSTARRALADDYLPADHKHHMWLRVDDTVGALQHTTSGTTDPRIAQRIIDDIDETSTQHQWDNRRPIDRPNSSSESTPQQNQVSHLTSVSPKLGGVLWRVQKEL